jgi:RNA polymerase sigma-70 factor (ECF subfamily)
MPGFSTTRWSLILVSGQGDARGRRALEELCAIYWRPVYSFIRRHGLSRDDAEDVTQSFFLHLVEHHGLARADPARGRFRSFLLTAARNFVANAHERDAAARRGGGAAHVPLEIEELERYLAADGEAHRSPESIFERQWALRLIERALDRTRAAYEARGQAEVFEALKPLLTSDAAPPPGVDAPTGAASTATRTALHRLRKRFATSLREEVGDTVGEAGDVEDELRHVLWVLTQ